MCGRKYYMAFIGKLRAFAATKWFRKWFRFDKVIAMFQCQLFETPCIDAHVRFMDHGVYNMLKAWRSKRSLTTRDSPVHGRPDPRRMPCSLMSEI